MRAILALALLLSACTAPMATHQTAEPTQILPDTARTSPASTPTPTATPFACSKDFCYPRLHIDVPLVDAYAADESGNNVVRYLDPQTVTYANAIVIFGHASVTQMSAITGWGSGDDVLVGARHFTVFAAITVYACVNTSRPPLAGLYMVTSINAESCASGQHQNIVVMAR